MTQHFFDQDLLPCPFCGGTAEFEYTPWDEETETGDDGTGWIECQTCNVQTEIADRESAKEQWNRRSFISQSERTNDDQ